MGHEGHHGVIEVSTEGDAGDSQPYRLIPGSRILVGREREAAIRTFLVWLKNCGNDRYERDLDSPIGRAYTKEKP